MEFDPGEVEGALHLLLIWEMTEALPQLGGVKTVTVVERLAALRAHMEPIMAQVYATLEGVSGEGSTAPAS